MSKSKVRTQWVCQQCGSSFAKWAGRCTNCGEWDALVETVVERNTAAMSSLASLAPRSAPQRIRDVTTDNFHRLRVPIDEFNRVLGGGIVPGSVVLISGDPGIGKCVTGDTRILDPLSGAFLPITEWSKEQRSVLSFDETTHHLAPQHLIAFLDQGVQAIVEVKTRLGRTLRCTVAHPVLTPDGWRAVSELATGSRIAAPRALPFFGNAKMVEDEVKLIAYALTDGAASSAISVTNAIPQIEDDLKKVARHFGVELRTYAKRNNRAKQYRFVQPLGERAEARKQIAEALRRVQVETDVRWAHWARAAGIRYELLNVWRRGEAAPGFDDLQKLAAAVSVPLDKLAPAARDRADMRTSVARFLESVRLRFVNANNKSIPDCIFQLPRAQLALFLKVLFSCDGSVYVNHQGQPGVSYSTISSRLAQDVQHLLLRFGFVSKLRTKWSLLNARPYKAFEVQLLGIPEIKRFLSEIGIWGREDAQRRINAMVLPRMPSTRADTIPTGALFWQQLHEASAGASVHKMSAEVGVRMHSGREQRPLAHSTVVALANAYSSDYLRLLAHSDIYWDEIQSITPAGKERVYDLSVPPQANFVANDLIVHNSTLLLQMAALQAESSGTVLYVSGEESTSQIRMRSQRLGLEPESLYLLTETNLDEIIGHINSLQPKLVVVDSIQTMYLEELGSAAGSVAQVRECTARLLQVAKGQSIPIFVVGHVTKSGTLAGPRVLEHIVDCVIYLEGERFHTYRLLRSVKNRFGATDEVGVFEMTQEGMVEINNPSAAFLAERAAHSAGNAIAVTMEGTRPLLVEIQGLTSTSAFGLPRRTANGVDMSRLLLLTAVLTKRVGMKLYNQDIFVNVIGGMKISEPAADLSIAVAIASSFREQPVFDDLAVMGEVGLSGELRTISQAEKRLKEASKLGFGRALVPHALANTKNKSNGIELIGVRNVNEALEVALSR